MRDFCREGKHPPQVKHKDYGLWFKEIIRYRVVDIAELVFNSGAPNKLLNRTVVPVNSVTKLVCG